MPPQLQLSLYITRKKAASPEGCRNSEQLLQMLVSVDPVIVPEQEWLDHRSELHVQIEEVYSECYNEQTGYNEEQVEQQLESLFSPASLTFSLDSFFHF